MDPSESSWDDVDVVGRYDVLQANEGNILPQDQDTIDKVRGWLHPTGYEDEGSEYHKHLSSHLSGTGAWLLNSSTYQQWHGGDEYGMLWLRGIPGSGKSVLAASIIQHLLQQEQVPVLYFFFRQIVDSNHTPRAALQDWLAQILLFSPPLQLQLKSYLKSTKKKDEDQNLSQSRDLSSLSTADLWQHLRTALAHLPKSYIVVDALDEMDYTQDTEIFLQQLSDLAHWRPSQVKILATSRPVAMIERALRKESMLHLRLKEEEVDIDIGIYVRSRIASSAIPPDFHAPLQAAVPGRAKGLFLYAKLAMDTFLEAGVDLQESLDRLPDNLNLMYNQLLHEHAKKTDSSQDLQLLIMKWITHSIRPLRLIELSDMIKHEVLFGNQDLGTAKNYVRSACGPLLELLPDETLCVIHHSLTEYLLGTTRIEPSDYPILEPGPTHMQLALICLSYLQSGCLEGVEPNPEPKQGPFSSRYTEKEPLLAPFTRYAALNWHLHAKKSSVLGVDQTEMNMMLDKFTAHAHFQRWAQVARSQLDTSRTISPLLMAVQLGLSDYLRVIITHSDTDCNEGAPIVWAADKGFADVVELLIQNGANVNQFDDEGYTALHRATLGNHFEVVRLLLQAGCKMQRSTKLKSFDRGFRTHQYSALWYACSHGHHEALAELKPYIKSSNEIEAALSPAIARKRTTIIKQLLDPPPIDLEKSTLDSLLQSACSLRHPDIISLLIAAGADVNQYALHALANSKEAADPQDTERCFKMILDTGAELHRKRPDSYHNTPLHQAADVIAARILFEAGADVNAHNKGKETPLHTCTDIEVLEFLVKTGKANLEQTDHWGATPLLSALGSSLGSGKNAKQILALVDLGADVNAVDREGNGVFHLAVKHLYYAKDEAGELIPRFCAAGADIDRTNNRGEAPIHLTKIEIGKPIGFSALDSRYPGAEVPKSTTLFESFVAAGASLAPPPPGISRTPFFNWISKSVCQDHRDLPKILEILTKSGGSLHITDDSGRTLLHEAVHSPRCRTQVQFLVDNGLDPLAVDNEGKTLWHEAGKSGWFIDPQNPEPYTQLMELGVDPTRANFHGRTALHVFSSCWPEAVYDFKQSSGQDNTKLAFDLVLALFPNVDVADKDGVTSLHIASTFSEFLVRRLLERNADPARVTNEGCNALHVSSRARNSNILGMLLSYLKSRSTTAVASTVNAKDHLGRTPLYYAYLVGSYECVKYLVDAGSTVDISVYECSPWKGLADIEAETENWNDYTREHKTGAVLLADKHRPDRNGWNWRIRNDELIALLLARTTSLPTFMDQAITDAAVHKADYMVERLLRERRSMSFAEDLNTTSLITECVDRRQTKRADQEKPCKNCKKIHTTSHIHHAVGMGDYHILSDTILESDMSEKDRAALISTVQRFVAEGFALALQELIASGGQMFLDMIVAEDEKNRLQGMKLGLWGRDTKGPLLLNAASRDEPNMEVVRLLVEKVGLDINAQRSVAEMRPGHSHSSNIDFGRLVEGESILHVLVRGEHWWHANEALPYLLECGANTEVRNVHDETPLSALLNRSGWLIFDKRVAELLIHYGANVNAIDASGQSCLAKACKNMEMALVLVESGAEVTSDVFEEAFKSNNADLVEILLSRGTDPNVLTTQPAPHPAGYNEILHRNRYPLHWLLSMSTWRLKTDSEQKNYARMVQLMLDHGADPCAKYETTTVLHELIKENIDVNALFTKPGVYLDLDCRDSSGQTPLMVTSLQRSSPDSTQNNNAEGRSIFSLLVIHGADIRAKDNEENNILHMFADRGSFGLKPADFIPIVQQAPELINQRNAKGNTPLHLAMKSATYSKGLDLYLEHGGDIHATDGAGNTMLHILVAQDWAVTKQQTLKGKVFELFTHLISKGIDINARNLAGETPIFSFLRAGTVESRTKNPLLSSCPPDQLIFDLFTEHGVDWQLINAQGQNLLHIVAITATAQRYNMFDDGNLGVWAAERFKALLALGLDAGLEDEAGRTPVDCAAELGIQEILDLFQKK
ncbi:ankyrin [Pyrenochaeta sp. DS3sAY3a]|nr:ankyrin [Pyrenochaeta sp. DS3sAY3a]